LEEYGKTARPLNGAHIVPSRPSLEKMSWRRELDACECGRLNFYRQRPELWRKTERAVRDLDFALRQPAKKVPQLLGLRVCFLLK
jgi:hypothetical protein